MPKRHMNQMGDEDVEGHKKKLTEDDVEGHGFGNVRAAGITGPRATGDEDVEGHGFGNVRAAGITGPRATGDDEDVEGHSYTFKPR